MEINCFSTVPNLLDALPLECQQIFLRTGVEEILTNLVIAQFDERFDTSFKNESAPNTLEQLGFPTHVRWMNSWSSMKLKFNSNPEYLDSIFGALKEKFYRLQLRDLRGPDPSLKTFDQKMHVLSNFASLALGAEHPLSPNLKIKLLNFIFDIIDQRLSLATRLHDMNCQFLNCLQSSYSSDIYQLIKALANLGELHARIANQSRPFILTDELSPGVRELIAQLKKGEDQRDLHLLLIGLGLEPQVSLLTYPAARISRDLHKLQNWIGHYQSMARLWEEKGLFHSSAKKLESGLNDRSIELTLANMSTLNATLREDVADFQRNRSRVIEAMLTENGNQQKKTHLQTELNDKQKQLGFLLEDLQGIQFAFQTSETEVGKQTGQLLQTFQNMKFRTLYQGNPETTNLRESVEPNPH